MKGIVLAGGKSSRFGENKALARLGGMTLLELAVRQIRKIKLDPIVIANPRYDYSFLDCPIWQDCIPDKGPLGGIYTACRQLKDEAFLVLTCDMPKISTVSLKLLFRHHARQNGATVFLNNHLLEPFPGVYESGLRDFIFESIEKGRYSMIEFLQGLPAFKPVVLSSEKRHFLNVNTQAELP